MYGGKLGSSSLTGCVSSPTHKSRRFGSKEKGGYLHPSFLTGQKDQYFIHHSNIKRELHADTNHTAWLRKTPENEGERCKILNI